MTSEMEKPFLPLDIIINILKRLPIESIVKFRYVCKEWKDVIKTQYFISQQHSHSHSHHQNPFLLLHGTTGHPRSLYLLNHNNMETVESLVIPSFGSNIHSWKIVGSCNGLICIKGDNGAKSIWLWNPVIREKREIPLNSLDYRGFSLYGFGFSSLINDYKIVRFYKQECHKNKEDHLKHHICYDGVEVFSLSTGSWKKLKFDFGAFQSCRTFKAKHVCVDGTIFWLGRGDSSYMIFSFNVATEVFTLTPIAIISLKPTERVFQIGLDVCDNKLEVHFASLGLPKSYFIRVCVMEEVPNESGKSFVFAEKYKFGPMSQWIYPRCICKNEIACITILHGAITLFNLITNERRNFNCPQQQNRASTLCGFHNYEKSLVSVWNN